MISKEEAVAFISDTLKVNSPLEKVAKDRYQFLKELIPAFQGTIPFQNVSLVAVPPHLRKR